MKKKLILSTLCFVLLLIMMLSTTVAWFTDTKSNVNTMVTGKISIEQKEYSDRAHTFEFENNKFVMMPSQTVIKEVVVTNTGNQPAYVRTLIAFEDMDIDDPKTSDVVESMVGYLTLGDAKVVIPGVNADGAKIQFTAGDTLYTVGYYLHGDELAANANYTCLNSITLQAAAPNEWHEAADEQYQILVLSQAVQTTGLTGGAAAALDEVFGTVAVNAADWFKSILN